MKKNNQIILSKKEAVDELMTYQDFTYELLEFVLQYDTENKLGPRRERMERMRNKLGVLKDKIIIIE